MHRTSVQVGLLVACILLVYLPSLQNSWVWLDDTNYVLENELVREFSVARTAELFDSIRGNFTPLTWLTHIASFRIFGEDALGHHLVSLLIHLINAVLVYLLARHAIALGFPAQPQEKQTGSWRYMPLLVGLLFGLHPQNVEAVAWIAARKDLLMTSFGLLCISSWLGYCQRHNMLRYVGSLMFFILAALAKPTAVMLVFPLFVISYWQSGNLSLRDCTQQSLLRTAPFLLAGMVIAWLAWSAQVSGGAVGGTGDFSLLDRGIIVLKNCWGYPMRFFMLGDYYVNYALVKSFAWQAAAGLLGLVVLLCAAVSVRYRGMAVLWLITLVLLVPGLGVAQYGVQAAGDRFAYLATIPLCLWTVWVCFVALDRLRDPRHYRPIAGLLLVGLLLVAGRAFMQTKVWRNDLSLWAHAVSVAPENPLVWQQLGYAFFRRGDHEHALEGFQESIARIDDGVYMDVRSLFFGLGVSSYEVGNSESAGNWFAKLQEQRLQGFDRAGYAYYYLARLADDAGDSATAVTYLDASLGLLPDYPAAQELRVELQRQPVGRP